MMEGFYPGSNGDEDSNQFASQQLHQSNHFNYNTRDTSRGTRGRPRRGQNNTIQHVSTPRNMEDGQSQPLRTRNTNQAIKVWNTSDGTLNTPVQSAYNEDGQTQNLRRWPNQNLPYIEDGQTQSFSAQNTNQLPHVWNMFDRNLYTPAVPPFIDNSNQYMSNNLNLYVISNNHIHYNPSASNNTQVMENQNNWNNALSNPYQDIQGNSMTYGDLTPNIAWTNNVPVCENTHQPEYSYSQNVSNDSDVYGNPNNSQLQIQDATTALQPWTNNNNSTVSVQPLPHDAYNSLAWDLPKPNCSGTLEQGFPMNQGEAFLAHPTPRRKELQRKTRSTTRGEYRNAPTHRYDLRHRQARNAPACAMQAKRRQPLLPTPGFDVPSGGGLYTHRSGGDTQGPRNSLQPSQAQPLQPNLPGPSSNNNNYASPQQKKNIVEEALNKLLKYKIRPQDIIAAVANLDHLRNCRKDASNLFCTECCEIINTYNHAKLCNDWNCALQLCPSLKLLFAKENEEIENNGASTSRLENSLDNLDIPGNIDFLLAFKDQLNNYF